MADVQESKDSRAAYYLDQLFTIGVCGALAGVTIMLWRSGLSKMLAEKFHIWVGLGGLSLLALVVVRAVSLWRSVDESAEEPADHGHSHGHAHGEGAACEHDHGITTERGHSHGHDHIQPQTTGGSLSLALTPAAPIGHSHSHGDGADHDHGYAPWRYIVLLLPVALYFLILSNPAFDRAPNDRPSNPLDYIQNFIIDFRSILWEALPFIVLGAVIAGMLEELLPQRVLVAILPKSRFAAIALGGLLGIVFPMCECGIIPIMRRLLRKGLPLSCCIAYLLAGPIINVVVLLSTYYAFSGMENVYEGSEPSWQMGGWYMVGFRAGLGYLTAIVTALVVDWQYSKHGDSLLTPLARPGLLPMADEETPYRSPWQRISNISETALHDFIDITVYLIMGALLAATARLVFTPDRIAEWGRSQPILAIVLMMGLAIVLCLCSEADAFVAASFVTLRPSAKVAFLVLGPMIDFKLYFMYTRIFRPRLIFTIYSAVIVQVFLYSLGTHYFWEKYAPDLITPRRVSRSVISEDQREAMVGKAARLFFAAPPCGSSPASVAAALGACVLDANEDIQEVRFTELEDASSTGDLRDFYQGRRVHLVGRFVGNEQSFTLTRYTINCCAADAQPIRVTIVVDQSVTATLPKSQLTGKWVRMTGEVQFYQFQGVWRTALNLKPRGDEVLIHTGEAAETKGRALVEIVPAPANPFVN
jgi:uncharacterized protein